jgi:O-antigen/teichoic acid export membrane protein
MKSNLLVLTKEKLINYFNSFKKRGGVHVFFAMIIGKIAAFLLSLLVIRILAKDIYGDISYAKSIIASILPFVGLGSAHSILRYCSIEDKPQRKASIFLYGFKNGLIITVVFLILFIILFSFIDIKIETARIYLIIMSFQFITSYILLSFQNYTRTLNKNIIFSYSQIIQSLGILVLGLSLTFFFKGIGLTVSYVLSPLLAGFYLVLKIGICREKRDNRENRIKIQKGFWKYGINVGIGSVASQLLYSLDIILIGILIASNEFIADYRVATILPLNLLFIPASMLMTDFVRIAKSYKNKSFLVKYATGMSSILFIIGGIILIVVFFFSKEIIGLLFGTKYLVAHEILRVLTVGMCFSFFLRIPFGNILAAVGRASWNVYIAYIMLIVNLILNYILIRRYGIIGAAYATSFTMLLSGLLSIGAFFLYINRIDYYIKREEKSMTDNIDIVIQD